jgi:hypothetical protein
MILDQKIDFKKKKLDPFFQAEKQKISSFSNVFKK